VGGTAEVAGITGTHPYSQHLHVLPKTSANSDMNSFNDLCIRFPLFQFLQYHNIAYVICLSVGSDECANNKIIDADIAGIIASDVPTERDQHVARMGMIPRRYTKFVMIHYEEVFKESS
jgi:hypothetical protein